MESTPAWQCNIFPIIGYLMIAIPTLLTMVFIRHLWVNSDTADDLRSVWEDDFKNVGKKKILFTMGKGILIVIGIIAAVCAITSIAFLIIYAIDRYLFALKSLLAWCS